MNNSVSAPVGLHKKVLTTIDYETQNDYRLSTIDYEPDPPALAQEWVSIG